MKPTTPHNNITPMKKSEDTPVDAPYSHSPACPHGDWFEATSGTPELQQSKGYASVNFEWTLLLPTERSEWGASGDMKRWLPRASPLEEISGYPALSQTVNRILLIAAHSSFHPLGYSPLSSWLPESR